MVQSTFDKDQQAKSVHVLRCIADNCNSLSKSFDCFRRIEERLQQGDSLRADPLTGGLTNYSYRVYLEHCPKETLFAKLSFPYALWNPDKIAHYDVQRTRNEFEMMKMFAEIVPNSAPVPYLCAPIDDMMVLVTEWCEDDEQLACQISEGHMDPRVCVGLARSIANLHCVEFDPEFNGGIRKTMLSTFDTLQQKFESMRNSTDNNSRANLLVQEMGLRDCRLLVDTTRWHYEHSRDCLVHSDLHVKNILVERMTFDRSNEIRLGPSGTFSVVDWEMAFAGPIGRDLGSFYPFLLSCALAHALKGNREGSANLMKAMDLMWEEYSEGLRQGGKNEEFIDYAFRSILGWCGRFMFLGYFTAGSHVEDFPIDNSVDKEILLDSIGVLGVKFMRWGFDPAYTDIGAADFRRLFQATVWTETAFIVSLKTGKSIPPKPVDSLRRDSIGSLRNLLSRPGAVARLAQ